MPAAETIRLIGDDASIERVTFGVEKIGDGIKTFDVHVGGAGSPGKGFWLITAKAAAGSIFGALVVGDLFPADGDEIMVADDKAKLLTCTPFLDASGWSCQLTAQEVETTLLQDRVKKYRKGKSDADGSLKGVFTLGVTSEAGGLLTRFMRIVKKDAAGVITVSSIDSSPIFIRGVVRNTATAGETFAFMFAQIELFGIKLGADIGSKQEYESKFRLTGSDPVFYNQELVA